MPSLLQVPSRWQVGEEGCGGGGRVKQQGTRRPARMWPGGREEEEGSPGAGGCGVTRQRRWELERRPTPGRRSRRSELGKGSQDGVWQSGGGAPKPASSGPGSRMEKEPGSPGQRKAAPPPAPKGSPRVGEARGPPLLGASLRQDGRGLRQQVCAPRGARTGGRRGPGSWDGAERSRGKGDLPGR